MFVREDHRRYVSSLKLDFKKTLFRLMFNKFKIGEFFMVMKELTGVEMNAVSGSACAGGAMEACIVQYGGTAPKTTCTSCSCPIGTTDNGYAASIGYYYCFSLVTNLTRTADIMARDVNYCDTTDYHWFQDATHAGNGTAGVMASYAVC